MITQLGFIEKENKKFKEDDDDHDKKGEGNRGKKEEEEKKVAVRRREAGDQGLSALAQIKAELVQEIKDRK